MTRFPLRHLAVLVVIAVAAAAPAIAEDGAASSTVDAGTPFEDAGAAAPGAPADVADAGSAGADAPDAAGAQPAEDAGAATAKSTTPASPATEPPDGADVADAGPPPAEGGSTTVSARRPMTAASSSTVRDRDFLLRPHLQPADILNAVPGFYVVQHAGGGKANQYFLRGFDADHGTDVSINVDDVPVNLPSHGHGQGYSDLHWVMPDVISGIDVTKGPYSVDYGDFATAGVVNLKTKPTFQSNEVGGTIGLYDTYRVFGVAAPSIGNLTPYVAGEAYTTNGPFENPEKLQRYNLFAKLPFHIDDHQTITLNATSYASGWNASGQIPERAVLDGQLDRFGTEDPTEGGNSQRHSVYAQYEADGDAQRFTALAYLVHYRFRLFSDFTFFFRDPVNGDEIEQDDVRTLFGGKLKYTFDKSLGDFDFKTSFGFQARDDSIDNELWYAKKRVRLSNVVNAGIDEGALALTAEEDAAWRDYVRLVVGTRLDGLGAQVEDHNTPANSGVTMASIVSPKASLILSWPDVADLFLNGGFGFHSNDARGFTQSSDPTTPLVRAVGYEVGVRTAFNITDAAKLDVAGSLWGINLDSEIVWNGDDGTTEAAGATDRYGAEVELRAGLWKHVYFDFDGSLTHAAFHADAGNGGAVALAPTSLVSSGVSVRDIYGFYGRVGGFFIGDRPATDDGKIVAHGFFRLDSSLGWQTDWVNVALVVENVLDTPWSEAQFATVTRLKNETTPAACTGQAEPVFDNSHAFVGCNDLHFTPGSPIDAQLTATFSF
jgi:outer membrane receptor protein involved in Fe transport